MIASSSVEVLIVGGGAVGLATAIGLRHFGVGCVLVESHPSTPDFPKGRSINARTMEIFSQWGIDERVSAVGLPAEETSMAYLGDTLLSDDFLQIPRTEPGTAWARPCSRLACSQGLLEAGS